MSAHGRLLMDVSFTRTQPGTVGITRTVRRLREALAQLHSDDAGPPCVPVAFHSSGFRLAGDDTPMGVGRSYRRITGGRLRRLAVALVPGALLRLLWAGAERLVFDAHSAREPMLRCYPGDWLVLADESWNYPVWRAAAKARAEGARVLLVVYDLIPLQSPQFCTPLFRQVFGHWLASLLPVCDAVLCISRATEGELRPYAAARGINLPPVSHFRLGSDLPAPATAAQAKPVLVSWMAAPHPCFVIVGSIEPRKNHAFLLRAFERLWSEGLPVRLLVLGRPHPDCLPLVDRMMRHAQQGRLLLTLLDATDADIDHAYGRARALVFPSLAEGFGLPVVEARVRGCPVIASTLPALAELADGGVCLFDPSSMEQLLALLKDHARADKRAAVPPMAPFTWGDSARQLLGVAEALVGPIAGVPRRAAVAA